MPITASCPSCGTTVNAPDNLAGRLVKCPKCANPFTVPATAADAIQTAPPPLPTADPVPPPASRRPARAERDDARDWDDDASRDDYDRGIARRAPGGPNGLAIAGMVLGIVGFVLAFIPCAGWLLAIIMGIVGAVLSGVGLSAAGRLQSGKGMAIAGLVLSILAVIWGPVWFFIYFYAATRTLQQAVQQAAANPKAFQFQVNNPQGPPTPATGKVTLANGQATLQGNLAPNDPKDRVQVLSACKVYTIAMAAGKTYQIDLIRSDNGIDPFLRLEDAAGTNLAQDDDSGGNLNSRIIFPCTQAGEYRIIATSLIGGTGNFTLQVSEK